MFHVGIDWAGGHRDACLSRLYRTIRETVGTIPLGSH
jgi:hypothetical protein